MQRNGGPTSFIQITESVLILKQSCTIDLRTIQDLCQTLREYNFIAKDKRMLLLSPVVPLWY
jgi:hypothetical protein